MAALIVVILVAAAAAFVVYRLHQSRNVHGSSTVEFVATEPVVPRFHEEGVLWPTYGYSEARTRYIPDVKVRPPFRGIWRYRSQALLEFPPVIAYGRLYFTNNAGAAIAVNTKTGKRAWKHFEHRCVASSPAVHAHVVYATFLNRPPCNASRVTDGEVVAYAAGFGRVQWRTRIGPSESSPLVANGRVYVGDWRGNVYALDAATGRIRWTFHTKDRVKGGVALAGFRLFVGSYDGHVYALDARNGHLLWRSSAQARLGSSATFYATPAVAYGRVYIGATDGKVYSFGAASGKLRWSHGTGGYVYGSPAVWRKRVYVGSYSKTFFCFDAATGDVIWKFRANGPISGSATIIDGVVYFATLKRRTYGLDARTGRQLWSFPDGKYSPVVADKKRLYVVGYARMYGMVPR
ncbi:MAG: PQQ-binding-like beta-propeller repeat protein [Thermoleophilia bacterium]